LSEHSNSVTIISVDLSKGPFVASQALAREEAFTIA
jgi:hypothetical protein